MPKLRISIKLKSLINKTLDLTKSRDHDLKIGVKLNINMVAKKTKVSPKIDPQSTMGQLLSQEESVSLPKIGQIIEGNVISMGKNEVRIDVPGLTTGVIRGPELIDESGEYSNINTGDTVQTTVIDIENENGEIELSFKQAGHQKAWERLEKLMKQAEVVDATIYEANKGGLMVYVGKVSGFLPVSQLIPEHYPRVEGGNRNKILEKLRGYVSQSFKVKIINVDEKEDKLIVSEKAAWEETKKGVISGYKVGDKVEGRITGVVEFGAFIEFGDGLEGLIHISELAWQRIDNPKEIINVGDKAKAEIISIDNSKISLSMKKLINDPWQDISKRYKVGKKVRGKVLKLNPFGAFVQLDNDIHGLAHISELSNKKVSDPGDVVKIGDNYDFKVLSIEPKDHRLGLSIRALYEDKNKKPEPKKPETDKKEEKEKKPISSAKNEDANKEEKTKKDTKKTKK